MKKFLIGCSIVAGVIFLIGIGSVGFMFMKLKSSMPDTERLERFEAELAERYPPAEAYEPRTDGLLVDSIQMARFVRLREELALPRADAAASLDDLTGRFGEEFEQASGWEKFKTIVGSVGGGVDLAGHMVEYVAVRDSLLLAHDMGPGEFTYLNSLVLFSWMEWDPFAGLEDDPALSGDTNISEAAEDVIQSARRLFRQQLGNQAEALAALEVPTPEQAELQARLDAELDRPRDGRLDFPFRGRLDEATLEVLTTFEFDLQATRPETFGEMVVEGANFQDVEANDGGIRIETR